MCNYHGHQLNTFGDGINLNRSMLEGSMPVSELGFCHQLWHGVEYAYGAQGKLQDSSASFFALSGLSAVRRRNQLRELEDTTRGLIDVCSIY